MLEKTRVYHANEEPRGPREQMKTAGVRQWHDAEQLTISEDDLICTLHCPLSEVAAVATTERNAKGTAPSAVGTTMEAM